MADKRRNDPRPETALGEGLPANVDIHRLGEGDNPQLDWGEANEGPADEVAHGRNHANRPRKTDAVVGQGRNTVQRNREIVRGKLYN